MKNWLGGRFASGKTRFSCTRISIHDDNGDLAGCVDRAGFNGKEFEIEGWVNASTVTLYVGGQQATTSPEFSRPDVAQAHGLADNLGFFVKVSTSLQEMELSDSPGITFEAVTGQVAIPPLSLPISRD